jgi:hypothetical protein
MTATNVKGTMMSKENGRWLRAQRRARAWNVPKMAHEMRAVADAAGDNVPTVATMEAHVRRWERGVVDPSERYMLYYCKAFGIRADQYGPGNEDGPAAEAGDGHGGAAVSGAAVTAGTPGPAAGGGPGGRYRPAWRVPAVAGPSWPCPLSAAGDVAYRWVQEPDVGDSWIRREVSMAAHESSGQAEHAERRDIGETTLEQMRIDVIRLSREYMTGQPLPLFFEMRRVRDRMHAALDRRLWPRDMTGLYFLLGCVNCLMAIAAKALGYPTAAGELVRAGQAYAAGIDNRPLMARLRMEAADIAYLYDRPRQAYEHTQGALQYLSAGPNAALIHLVAGQAAARLGQVDTARAAITAASEARESKPKFPDDLLALGGEFTFSRASQYFYGGATLSASKLCEPPRR